MAESITITDNRTGNSIEIPIVSGGVDATAWRKLLPGIWFHDPGMATTAVTSSSVAEIDGETGILRYRGYPIEQLAEQSTFPEVAHLLIYGELPTQAELDEWVDLITHHTFIHENFRKRIFDAFHY
ncbi:MAG: citrate (Si)-synthase, partial [Acidimicrobiaceae bacterium]|nr:citrate (Si)-synthase [Acidimicrobiaceae bacterium]